jgi:hypothetical protein
VERCVAPPALGDFYNTDPALTRWANVWRAYGASGTSVFTAERWEGSRKMATSRPGRDKFRRRYMGRKKAGLKSGLYISEEQKHRSVRQESDRKQKTGDYNHDKKMSL